MRAGLYARVSTGTQEKEKTIVSQLEALRDYAKGKGYTIIDEFVDDGFSGADLNRPELDRLRDVIQSGEIELVLFHSPDRLARKALYLGLMLEEFEKCGIQVEFMNQPTDDTPESKMMLGMQGLFAEYERAKIAERSRRGRIHWAKQGALAGGHVPYGYKRIYRSRENGTRARMEIEPSEAAIVKDMYRWLIEEQLSFRQIAKRLSDMGIPTRTGGARWVPTTISQIIRNSTYMGIHYQLCKESVEPSIKQGNNGYRPKKSSRRKRPQEDWIPSSVPAILDEQIWHMAQKQIEQNTIHSPRNNKRNRYLLKGFIICPICGWRYVGFKHRGVLRYRCGKYDPIKATDGQRCKGKWIRADRIEHSVWDAICSGITNPEVFQDEYRNLPENNVNEDTYEPDRKRIETSLKRISDKQDRLLDAYLTKAIDLDTYKVKTSELTTSKTQLENKLTNIEKRIHHQVAQEEALNQLENLCGILNTGLDDFTFDEKQKLLRLLVERIRIDGDKIKVDIVFPSGQTEDQQDHLRYSRAGGNPEGSREVDSGSKAGMTYPI